VIKDVLVGDATITIRHSIPIPWGAPQNEGSQPEKAQITFCVRGVLSPLLSNILLTDLDRELEKRGHSFCRYADDCNVYVGRQRVMAEITCVFRAKTETEGQCRQERSGATGAAEVPGLQCHVASETEAENRAAQPPTFRGENPSELRGARGRSLRQVIAQLNPVLRGWLAYFRLTEERGVLEEFDGWLRRKLRVLLWRQWKRVSTRAKHLMRAGLSHVRAWQSATNGYGPWWNGVSSHMNEAFPTSWFERMGLISLLATQRRFSLVS
jgi:RNA-directed DNA polymerase